MNLTIMAHQNRETKSPIIKKRTISSKGSKSKEKTMVFTIEEEEEEDERVPEETD